MFVDILITTYKREEDLLVLLKNLEKQSFHNFQVQIFDGTPGDNVKKSINEYIRNRKKSLFTVIYHKTTHGMTRQRNIAVENTTGDVSIFLDDDVELFPDYLAEVIKVFTADTKIQIAGLNGFDMREIPASGKRKLGKRKKIYRLIGLLPDIGPAKYLPWGHGTPHFNNLKSGTENVDLLIGHNMAFRTKILKQFKFDKFFEQYDTYVLYDDQDICLRLKEEGYKLVLCHDAKLVHNVSQHGRPAHSHYGFQAFYNAHRNWNLFGSKKPIHKLKFWMWEFLDILFQLFNNKTREMSKGRLKIFIKTIYNYKLKNIS